VDTNVFAYAFGPPEGGKKEQAIQLLRDLGDHIVVSTQVIHELYWTLTRKFAIDTRVARAVIHDLLDGTVISTTPAISAEAIDLSILYKFTLWDALVVQAAIEGKCHKVLSEDFSHGQLVKGIRILNPFRPSDE
jgi:predicted nucleic acid-binding protein